MGLASRSDVVQGYFQASAVPTAIVQRKAAPPVPLPGMARPNGHATAGAAQRRAAQPIALSPVQLQPAGPGAIIDRDLRTQLELILDSDLSTVRIHETEAAAAIGALAFTRGENIYFAPGQYAPRSQQGLALLGHELAHVLQQRQGRVKNPYRSGVTVVQVPALEAEADRMGRLVAERMRAAGHARPILQRMEAEAPSRESQAHAYYDKLVRISSILRTTTATSDFVENMRGIFLDSGAIFDWVTEYNPLRWGIPPKNREALAGDLIEWAEALNVDGNLALLRGFGQTTSSTSTDAKSELTRAELLSATIKAAQVYISARPSGPNTGEGKTMAALCVLNTGSIYAAASGNPKNHNWASRTLSIVAGVDQVEEWPVLACAEVHALDKAIVAHELINFGETHLFTYCFTWRGKWVGRAACRNCWQWVKKYKK